MSEKQKIEGRKTKVFMSYSRKDSAYVSRLIEGLEREDDIEVFRDTEDILPTEEWKDRLEQLIGEADTIVFALSPHSAKSEICRWEVDHAESLNKRIAPIVIRDVAASRIPEPLTKYNYIFFTKGHDFDKALANLVTALDADIDWIREHTRLGEIARRWEAQQKLGAQPLRGRELEAAEQWLAAQPAKAPSPTGPHRQYIADSRRLATRRQQSWVSGSLMAVVVTCVLAAYAFLQKQEAERNLAQALSAADTLVIEIGHGMKDFKRVPITRIRSVLEKAEGILKSLESAGKSSQVRHSQAQMFDSFVSAYQTLGDLEKAHDRAKQSLTIMEALVTENPANTRWQRDLSISHAKIGDILIAQGDLSGAAKAHSASLAVRERLAASDPANTQWQRDLSVSHDRIGDVLKARGDLTGAETAYRVPLAIFERLTASDPANTRWQRDLSISHSKIAGILKDRGDLAGAETAYLASHTIREQLAASDPTNAGWQHDLSVSHEKIGDVLKAQGDLIGASAGYRASLAIIERLAASDSANATWQRTLSISHEKIGDVLVKKGELVEAEKAYRASLVVRERLAASDPANAARQHDLSKSYQKIGKVLGPLGNFVGAETAYRAGLAIDKRLAASDPANVRWQASLAASHGNLAQLMMVMHKPADALRLLEAGRAIILPVAKTSGHRLWQGYLEIFDSEIARATKALEEIQ